MQLSSIALGQGFVNNSGSKTAVTSLVGEATPAVVEKKHWMQDVKIKRKGICTGDKYGSDSCPPGSKQYALAKTFRKAAHKHKGKKK